MYLKYGTYQHANNECSIVISREAIRNEHDVKIVPVPPPRARRRLCEIHVNVLHAELGKPSLPAPIGEALLPYLLAQIAHHSVVGVVSQAPKGNLTAELDRCAGFPEGMLESAFHARDEEDGADFRSRGGAGGAVHGGQPHDLGGELYGLVRGDPGRDGWRLGRGADADRGGRLYGDGPRGAREHARQAAQCAGQQRAAHL